MPSNRIELLFFISWYVWYFLFEYMDFTHYQLFFTCGRKKGEEKAQKKAQNYALLFEVSRSKEIFAYTFLCLLLNKRISNCPTITYQTYNTVWSMFLLLLLKKIAKPLDFAVDLHKAVSLQFQLQFPYSCVWLAKSFWSQSKFQKQRWAWEFFEKKLQISETGRTFIG